MKESTIFNEHDLTEKVHYVYRVVIDRYYYIGKRTGFLNDLITGRYKTSSKLVREKLKNGYHFSKIKILKVFSTSEEALEFENRILTRVNASTNPKFLNQQNGSGDFTLKQHTEKTKEKLSEIKIEYFNPETENGRRNKENQSKIRKEYFNPETEEGIKNKEKQSQLAKAQFDVFTEQGQKLRKEHSSKMKSFFDINSEDGRRNRENHSKIRKEYFNPNTEQGRINLEKAKVYAQKIAESRVKNRKSVSILSDLMFDEAFIKENFLITDDKNNPRFLWSVYSKLSGYSESHICKEKRIGKLRFLYGIKSIALTEEQESVKTEEIKVIIKSRNYEKE